MLRSQASQAGYGPAQVLFGVDLDGRRRRGGRRCSAATAWARRRPSAPSWACCRAGGGASRFDGARRHRRAAAIASRSCGIGLVPEGRQIFPTLTVRGKPGRDRRRRGRRRAGRSRESTRCFPRLDERRRHLGTQLSGGEQQMLAIGRALMTNPQLLILDEATEGLAPLIRAEIWRCLEALKARGQSILVIDKNVDALAALRRPARRDRKGPRRLDRNQRRPEADPA